MDEYRLAGMCTELSARVADESRKDLGKKWRCPRDLRMQVVEYAVACRKDGETLGAISARLGLVGSTLARWLRKRKKRKLVESDLEPGFRSVAIVPSEEIQPVTNRPELRLITADGHILEGLDFQSAAYLLKVRKGARYMKLVILFVRGSTNHAEGETGVF
jgi:hypothetical protein